MRKDLSPIQLNFILLKIVCNVTETVNYSHQHVQTLENERKGRNTIGENE
jgi:hypothetical protein